MTDRGIVTFLGAVFGVLMGALGGVFLAEIVVWLWDWIL